MKSSLRILTVFLAGGLAQAAVVFPPLDQWKAAVLAGDVAPLYSTTSPVSITAAKKPLADVSEEWKFWSHVKAAGATDFNAKILEIARTPNQTTLHLRVMFAEDGKRMFALVTQTWMKEGNQWRLVAVSRDGAFRNDPVRILPQPPTPNTNLYADPSEGEAELKEALAKAGKEHKRVIVVFGGNWCYDCHVLDTTFHSKDFAPLVNSNYVVVHINVGDDGKENGELGARLGVALDKGVPSLGVLDPDGTVVYAQKNGEFEATEKIGPADVRAFLEKWKPVTGRS